MPDFVALVLACSGACISRVAWAWAGLLCSAWIVDVHHGALLGQHALAYSALSFGAIALHRRIPSFGLLERAMHVLPLFALAHLLSLVVRLIMGGMWPGWPLVLAPVIEALLWPLASVLLLAPQRGVRRIATRTVRFSRL